MQKAAELGDVEAASNLGILYLNGEGVDTDLRKAVEYFRAAANAGHTASSFYLGILTLNGMGTA
jgi:TPR repeat protein